MAIRQLEALQEHETTWDLAIWTPSATAFVNFTGTAVRVIDSSESMILRALLLLPGRHSTIARQSDCFVEFVAGVPQQLVLLNQSPA